MSRFTLHARLSLALGALAAAVSIAAAAPSVALAAFPVTVTNGGCEHTEAAVMCQLDVTFSPVDGAASYTATVTSPDGQSTGYGTIAPGNSTLTVPYVGDGTYTVTVSAWADATPDAGQPAPPSGG